MTFSVVNVLDLINTIGESEVRFILSDFLCDKNTEIEEFIHKNAIEFSKKKMSMTYLVIDENAELAAIFTLTHKALQIGDEGLSQNARKKIQRFAQLDESTNLYVLSAFLIAQFGKNSGYKGNNLSGTDLMELVEEILLQAQRLVGGSVVFLECEEKAALLSFYQKEEIGYRVFDDRYAEEDATKYVQLFKFL